MKKHFFVPYFFFLISCSFTTQAYRVPDSNENTINNRSTSGYSNNNEDLRGGIPVPAEHLSALGNSAVIDTQAVNELARTGRLLHYKYPDSALYYYKRIVENYDRIKNRIDFDQVSEIKSAYFETIIQTLNHTGNIHYYDDEFIRAEMYYKQSLNLATKAGFLHYVGEANYDIGYTRYMNSDYLTAKTMFKKAYRLYAENNNKTGMYSALDACGRANKKLGLFRSADSCYSEALAIAIYLNDSLLIADVKIDLGILYCEQERLDEGMMLFEEALDFYQRSGNTDAVSDALINIGVVMQIAGEYEKALFYINKSTAIEEISQIKSQLAIRYYHLADLYLQQNEYDKAYDYCVKTMTIAGEIATRPFEAECNYLMGKYYSHQKMYHDAINYFTTALNIAKKSNNKLLLANIYRWYANVLVQSGQVDEAILLAGKAYSLATELKLISLKKEVAGLIFKSFEKKGNSRQALEWFRIYHNLSDSVNYFSQQKEIRRIEARYNYERKEQENVILRNQASLQEQRLKNRTITLFALILGIALSIITIVLLITRIRHAKTQNREQQLLSLKKLDDLTNELEGKDRELASKMMFLNQKNELIDRIINQLKELQNSKNVDYKEINTLVGDLKADEPQSNWKEFETQFIRVHPDFYKRLHSKHPEFTTYEQRLCAFLRMNLNTKEIASITGRSSKSIEVTRSRIRKKLKLSRRDNLSSFLASI